MKDEKQARHGQLVKRLLLMTAAMFGFGFALVPLYDVFCDITGLNGKISTSGPSQASTQTLDESREVRVQFITQNNESMSWEFYPLTKEVKVHPGQPVKVEFLARNPAARAMAGQAVPSVSTSRGADYFHKTECFCFTHQVLEPGEEIRMPVVFVVDTALPKDIRTLTLHYTLFDISEATIKTKG